MSDIGKGDWVVAGTNHSDLDIGQIHRMLGGADGDGRLDALVAWSSGETVEIDLMPDDVEIYATRAAAQAEYERREKEYGSR